MESFICPAIIVFLIGCYIWDAFTGGSDESEAYQQLIGKGLTLTSSMRDYSDPGEEPLLGLELFAEGAIEAGSENRPVDWVVTIRDVEGEDEHAILCAIPDISEDDCY
ncbi:MAG: hypothetical protein HOA14_14505, partial [Planctomycetaceae bacterium]|nr:hypothetical protein [Planctomycetaceae bacterium]